MRNVTFDMGAYRGMSDADILESLKAMCLIKPGRILVHRRRRWTSNFNAAAVRSPRAKIIFFNDSFQLCEQAVALAMLHEEGHIVQKQNLSWIKALWFVLAAIVALLIIGMGGGLTQNLSLVGLYFVFFASSPLMFRSYLMNDEIKADKFAGIQLGKVASNLSEAEVLMLLNEALGLVKKPGIIRRIEIAFGWDWHPPRNERARIIYEGICMSMSNS